MTRNQAIHLLRQMTEARHVQTVLTHIGAPSNFDTRREADMRAIADLLRDMADAITAPVASNASQG